MLNKSHGKKENKIRKITALILTSSLLILPSGFLWAEIDYPAGYMDPGYREYLSDKVQAGYYVDVFTKMERNQKERIDKRNQIENILNYSYQASPQSANEILNQLQEKNESSDYLVKTINEHSQKNTKDYVAHSDGKKVYYNRDGLVSRVENERVVDEFGNVSIRDSYNFQYDDRSLLTGFEADIKDILGNTTHIRQFGMRYTGDSVFYATKETNANKNIIEYFVEEIDPAGNKKATHFSNGVYEGKLLRAFSETIEDSVYGNTSFNRSNITYAGNDPEQPSSYHEEGVGTDGLAYTLDRNSIGYNGKNQITGYSEVSFVTHINSDGTTGVVKKTVEAKFTYLGVPQLFGPDVEDPDPDRLLESTITTTTEDPDGSKRTETVNTKFDYAGLQLIGANGVNNFNGQEADWYEYRDSQGRALSRNVDENGNVSYSYINPATGEEIIVPLDKVTATLKDGNLYQGSSTTQYQILFGKPMNLETNSLTSYSSPETLGLIRTEETKIKYANGLANNLQRLFDTNEHTDIIYTLLDSQENPQRGARDIKTTYFYAENGNLSDLKGEGYGSGYELTSDGWMDYLSAINVDYGVILGLTKQERYKEIRDYTNGENREITH